MGNLLAGLRLWRDTTAQYLQFFKKFKPDVEVITDAWPKLGQPDFTEVITKLIQAKPQALFTLLYAGEFSAFVNQGNVYALFGQITVATPNVDYPVLAAMKNLPPGIQSATRYLDTFPDTPANKEWGQAYLKRWNERPTNWSWQCAVAMQFYQEAIKKANSLDGKAIAAALTGMKINSPFGADGTITMRDDHTTIGYAIGWGADHSERAVHRRRQGRRLGQDPRTRDGVEEAAELYLISCCNGPRRARQLPRDISLPGHPDHQRTDRRDAAVPRRRGLTLIFGVLKVVNFAHGTFYMFGGYVAYGVSRNRQLRPCGARRRARDGGVRRGVRARPDEPRLRLQRADAAPDLLRRGADLRRRRQDRLGARVPRHGDAGGFQVPPLFIAGGVVPPFYALLIGIAALIAIALGLGLSMTRSVRRYARLRSTRRWCRRWASTPRCCLRSSSRSAAGSRDLQAHSRRPCARSLPAWASRS